MSDGSPREFEGTVTYASGERPVLVTVEPLDAGELARGEAVLARIRPRVETRAAAPAIPPPIVTEPTGETAPRRALERRRARRTRG